VKEKEREREKREREEREGEVLTRQACNHLSQTTTPTFF
jgi:hypothetical protein